MINLHLNQLSKLCMSKSGTWGGGIEGALIDESTCGSVYDSLVTTDDDLMPSLKHTTISRFVCS